MIPETFDDYRRLIDQMCLTTGRPQVIVDTETLVCPSCKALNTIAEYDVARRVNSLEEVSHDDSSPQVSGVLSGAPVQDGNGDFHGEFYFCTACGQIVTLHPDTFITYG